MQLSCFVVGVALVASTGCTRAAELSDQFRPADCHLPLDQRLRLESAALIIVLGHVLAVTEVGQPQPSSGDRRLKTQLTRIRIDIEMVLKGTIESDVIEFFYFTYSPVASDVDLGVPRYLPGVGQRRIYFLTVFNGSYRSVGDVTDYTLRVSSGKHDRGACKGQSPGCCIAQLLLVPQETFDADWFVADLIKSEYVAEVLCSRNMAQELIQKLTHHPDQRISDRARLVIAGTHSPR